MKCFIYELFDDVCCDSGWNDEKIYLFTAQHTQKCENDRERNKKFPFFFHNLNALSSFVCGNATLHFISISHLITSDTFVGRHRERQRGRGRRREKNVAARARRKIHEGKRTTTINHYWYISTRRWLAIKWSCRLIWWEREERKMFEIYIRRPGTHDDESES